MTQSRKCPKCAGAMSNGFIIDKLINGAVVPAWIEGEPKKSFWFGHLKLRGTKPVEVTTWRCPSCGFLESYAAPK